MKQKVNSKAPNFKLPSTDGNIFELKNSINSKKSFGGTSFDNVRKMIMKYKKTK